jgi:cytolysin-activating lysine-acyltransferase
MLSFYEKIGIASWLMTKSSEYSQYPAACISAWIEPAVLHDQIHFFLGPDQRPTGYFTWAFLAPDTERRLISDPDVLFHISEWNEGDRLWIMDLVLVGDDLRTRIQDVRRMFPQQSIASSIRRDEDGAVRKLVTWKTRA